MRSAYQKGHLPGLKKTNKMKVFSNEALNRSTLRRLRSARILIRDIGDLDIAGIETLACDLVCII